ncbi:hydroxypyruvate isomerase [Phaeobacter inhibens]|uniref:2-oxo-tetronate isomerase n=1 Tax=Phaeobacter inhibens TaxID=221822 RepID=UPI00276EDE26|nr:2-oxo-tetronate isomerase [Phaeobacter inhibens]GLO72784.1 hydroxypyruvate isomerase [Phaeobacter inhibens]
MLNYAANLSFLFPALTFPDRFTAASAAGFKACEYLFPYDYEPDGIQGLLAKSGLKQALFNLSPGDWDAGERGLAALPSRVQDFAASVETALRYAEATGCQNLHIMAGNADPQCTASHDTYLANLTHAAARFHDAGITALIEPINPTDMPGYFLTEVDQALDIITTVAAPNLKLQFDCYHRAMVGKDVIAGLELAGDRIGHIQIAGAPGRNEPGTGTLDYAPIFRRLQAMGYEGWIGCEYRPAGKTVEGLAWLADHI